MPPDTPRSVPPASPYPIPGSLFPLAESFSTGILLHRGGPVLFANRAMSRLTGLTSQELAGCSFWDLFPAQVRDQGRARLAGENHAAHHETLILTASAEERWVELSIATESIQGEETFVCSFIDITERKNAESGLLRLQAELEATVAIRTEQLQQAMARLEEDIERREKAEEELLKRYTELTELNCRLHDTQEQLVQSEKMASIGQLAAGVAHEINNPIGYVHSNIRSLKGYIDQLLDVVDAYAAREGALPPGEAAALQQLRKAADFDFIREDIHALLSESAEGAERVRKIVQDLRDFSRSDANQDWQASDLHHGLDSTLNIASNEIKYRADVHREYGELPLVECLQSQLNQVFMNLFVNAAQAMPDDRRGLITIRTGLAGEQVWIEVSDNGRGIPPDVIPRIFDPFFTTKPVGKGTGLGLSLSYGIIQKHHGKISVSSTPDAGTTFRITLPIHHPASSGAPQ